jgi:hypothetical protein
VRWEFYLGGMLGAVLSFVLRVQPLLGEDIVPEAIAAGLRAVAWFVAFGVLERVAWSRGEYVGGLMVGIAALLLALLVVPGLTAPSVAGLLWLAVALVLALVAPPVPSWLGRQSWISALVLPVFLGGGVGYMALVFYPAEVVASNTQKARLAGGLFFIDQDKRPDKRTIGNPLKYLRTRVIEPLEEAEKLDRGQDGKGNVRTRVLLASWSVQLWALSPLAMGNADVGGKAVAWAVLARAANPEGPEGYLAEYEVRERIARILRLLVERLKKDAAAPKVKKAQKEQSLRLAKDLEGKVRKQYTLAGDALEPYLPRDPTNPQLRYRLAEARFKAGDTDAGLEHAREAQKLDARVSEPRKLSDPQREQLRQWLEKGTSR